VGLKTGRRAELRLLHAVTGMILAAAIPTNDVFASSARVETCARAVALPSAGDGFPAVVASP
jgi:hypothetical protein